MDELDVGHTTHEVSERRAWSGVDPSSARRTIAHGFLRIGDGQCQPPIRWNITDPPPFDPGTNNDNCNGGSGSDPIANCEITVQ